MEISTDSGQTSVTETVFLHADTFVMSVAGCLLDLNFVVDSSESMNSRPARSWDITLEFIANVISQFTIGPNNVQVAFVLFNAGPTIEWGLTLYRDSASLLAAIRNVRYIGTTIIRNLNAALYLTRTQVFGPGSGTRPNAVKATIILTDGIDNVRPSLTIANATECKNQGIRLIAIGISYNVDGDRLLQIVSSPSDYHAVDDFDTLPSVIAQLQPEQICFRAPTPPPGPSTGRY